MKKVNVKLMGLTLSNSSLAPFINTTVAVQAVVIESNDPEVRPFVGQYLLQKQEVFAVAPSSVRLEMTTVNEAQDSSYKQFLLSEPEKMRYITVECDHRSLHFKKDRWFESPKGAQLMLKIQPNPKLGRTEPTFIDLKEEGPEGELAPLRKENCFLYHQQQLTEATEVTAEQLEQLLERLLYVCNAEGE